MKKTINQIEYIKYELNEKLMSALSGVIMEGRTIMDINELVLQNRNLSKELSEVIVSRALNEKTSTSKLRILYVIDSIIKNKGTEFLLHLSPHIYRIFEETFTTADDENKINLFKLFYSWKYFLDKNILESLSSRFNFNELKKRLMTERPELIDKYDRYNESVFESIRKEMIVKPTQLQVNSNQNILISNSSVIPSKITQNINQNSIQYPITNINKSLTENKNMNKSLLSEVIDISSKNKNRAVKKAEDDLFSSSDTSPMLSQDSSDNERKISKKTKINNNTKTIQRSEPKKKERVSEFADFFSDNINDFEFKKRKSDNIYNSVGIQNIKESGNMSVNNLTNKPKQKIDNPNSILNNSTMNGNLNSIANLNVNNLSNTNSFNSANQPKNIKSENSNMLTDEPLISIQNNQKILNSIFLQNPQLANLVSNLNLSLLNPQNKQQELNNPTSSATHSTPTNSDALNPFHDFINLSTVSLNTKSNLFSSFGRFLNDSLLKSSPVEELMRDSKDNIKNPMDILKLRDFNSKEYQKFNEKVINSLSTELRNVCSICGFRTKFYTKFVEHLDIHFHINYIRRNSQKKVLYRKESFDRSNWIKLGSNQFSFDKKEAVNNSFTLSSVLFYQNDSDFHHNNKKDMRSVDNVDDNEGLIIPVQQDEEVKCVYCAEEFKKRYIIKFNYWFYVNVIKFNKDEIINNQDNPSVVNRNEFELIHESCIEEYMKMYKYQAGNQFLKEKRTR